MSQTPDWLEAAVLRWGALANTGISIRRLSATTGLSKYKAGTLIKHVKANGSSPDQNEETTQDEDSADEVEVSKYLHATEYYYNEETDTYVTYIKSSPKPIVLPGHMHRSMKRAYSNWDGQPGTINQICRSFEIPRPWFVEYKAKHGWTHDSEPFSNEEMLEKDTDELVADALQIRKMVLFQQYEIAKWKAIQKDANKWNRFEQEVLGSLIEGIGEGAGGYSVPTLELIDSEHPFVLVMGLTDFHWGAYAWGPETGDGYSRPKAERRLRETTQEILRRLPSAPDEIILPIGSDFFDVDGDSASTTKGTPQDSDGTPSEILITGCEMTRLYIDLLRQVAPVRCVMMAGNHDRHNGLALLLYLNAWYRDTDDVTVVMDYAPRVYVEYGDNLLAFSHGDGSRTKPRDLAHIVATEARRMWGRTEHHLAFGGHLHHQKVEEHGGLVHYLMPSLAGHDRWHSRNGYVTAKPALQAYVIDEAGGVSTVITAQAK